jgi:hypothetical protein
MESSLSGLRHKELLSFDHFTKCFLDVEVRMNHSSSQNLLQLISTCTMKSSLHLEVQRVCD